METPPAESPPVREPGAPTSTPPTRDVAFVVRLGVVLAALIGAAVAAETSFTSPIQARAAFLTAACLTLWLSEIIPAFATTLALFAAIPLLLGGHDAAYSLGQVLGWAGDPVLALFLGGFALSVAAGRYGIDAAVARLAIRGAGGRQLRLLVLVTVATAGLSMWMSNIAAAAMMIAALRPLFAGGPPDAPFRQATLLGIAMGANLGGMATPIGSGPNGIAIAAAAKYQAITFVGWMTFALPLTLGMVAVALGVIVLMHRVRGPLELVALPAAPPTPGVGRLVVLFTLTVLAWLTEPLHHVPSAVVALITTAVLFGSGLLHRGDLQKLDWASLLLIAGGITLGRLLETSHLIVTLAGATDWSVFSPQVQLFALLFSSALLSALMSNTATAVILTPLALSLLPQASTAVLIALSASFGVLFPISTPPNAMAYGEGGLKMRDLGAPGLVLLGVGCVLLTWTGPWVLRVLGIP